MSKPEFEFDAVIRRESEGRSGWNGFWPKWRRSHRRSRAGDHEGGTHGNDQ